LVTLSSVTVSLASIVNTVLAPTWLVAFIAAVKFANSVVFLGDSEVGHVVVTHGVGEREGVGTGAAGENRAGGAGDDQGIQRRRSCTARRRLPAPLQPQQERAAA
jgi:hypothetical protein